MPTNTAITSSIVAGIVPPDRMCVKDGQQVANICQDFCSIQGTDSSGGSSPDNSIAELALNTANTALAAVQELQAAQKEVRVTSTPIAIPTGDSNFSYSFSPPMPSTEYTVSVAYLAGATGFASAFYGWRILESSITVGGFSILFDNSPANHKVTVRVVQN